MRRKYDALDFRGRKKATHTLEQASGLLTENYGPVEDDECKVVDKIHHREPMINSPGAIKKQLFQWLLSPWDRQYFLQNLVGTSLFRKFDNALCYIEYFENLQIFR